MDGMCGSAMRVYILLLWAFLVSVEAPGEVVEGHEVRLWLRSKGGVPREGLDLLPCSHPLHLKNDDSQVYLTSHQ
jgi:hypothetical protein